MDTSPEPLEVEIQHDRTHRTEAIIGALVVIIVLMGGVIWYMATHAPGVGPLGPQATSTPNGASTMPDKVIEEHAKYYDVKAVYPSSTSLKTTAGVEADAKAVEIMKQFELNTIEGFKEQGNFANLTAEDIKIMRLDERKQSLEIKYEMKSGPKTVSYVYMMYMDTLGAHPNTFFRTFTFDAASGAGLQIDDVFAPGTNYLNILSTQSRKLLPAAIAAREGISVSSVDTDYLNRGTTPDADNFQNWYIEGSNLVIVFPPYQLAPYAAGVLTVSIPFSHISSSLNAAYK
jgi:hypothetical protein